MEVGRRRACSCFLSSSSPASASTAHVLSLVDASVFTPAAVPCGVNGLPALDSKFTSFLTETYGAPQGSHGRKKSVNLRAIEFTIRALGFSHVYVIM